MALNNPWEGQPVKIWYNKKAAPHMRHHGKIGQVSIANRKGNPKNHAVLVDGECISIPGGQLNKVLLG